MPSTPKPFAGFEFLIAWRYIRAKRAEGGVSVMTWISFLGIMLAVIIFGESEKMTSGFYLGTLIILIAVLTYPLLKKLFSQANPAPEPSPALASGKDS